MTHTLKCRQCGEKLAKVESAANVKLVPPVEPDWVSLDAFTITCPACGTERTITVTPRQPERRAA